MKRFILVRQGPKTSKFPNVTIHDTTETEPAFINGRPTRIYKQISGVLYYLDAFPLIKKLELHYANR